MPAFTVTPVADADVPEVIALWQSCNLLRPWNDPVADIELARRGPNSTVLVGRFGEEIVATVMVGHDGHRGAFYYVAVVPTRRRHGFGRAIMTAAETWLAARGIAKAQLMVRPDNATVADFYRALGYGDQPRVLLAKWLDGRELTP